MHLFSTVFLFLFLVVFFITPLSLTIMNVVLLFREKKIKTRSINISDFLTFVLGTTYTALFAFFCDFHQWNEQLYFPIEKFNEFGTYTPISLDSLPTFLTLCFVAIGGYVVLRIFKQKLSPVVASICYGSIFLGFCLTIALTVQLWSDIFRIPTILLLLFPLNYILCSIRLIKNTAKEFSEIISKRIYKNKFLQLCNNFLSKSTSFVFVSFLVSIPLLILVIIILLLFGQQPDEVVKMFTETAEWTLSQQIPPPRLDYDGHYLCTVAACGDRHIVKPIRAGKRNNELIVVNRQLLVANAFEDLISVKVPKIHKIIRKTYDRLGLPISKYINTKRSSNLVYFIMKPLEWLFIFVLYTFDNKPENRIHRQYLG